MNLVKCTRGHFYDESKYNRCPHCERAGIGEGNLTAPVLHSGSDAVTVSLANAGGNAPAVTGAPAWAAAGAAAEAAAFRSPSLEEAVKNAVGDSPSGAIDAGYDQKTVSFYKKSIGVEPVVGWMVCVGGPHLGEDFRLKSGRNFIGRSVGQDVVIARDNSVSREQHAVVVYEPRSCAFMVLPGDSKELCYINDCAVLTPQGLKLYDRLKVGETELMFIPCCGPDFNWDHAKKNTEEEK
jgi:hypothetical protein